MSPRTSWVEDGVVAVTLHPDGSMTLTEEPLRQKQQGTSTMIKVHGGTPRGDVHLCSSCRHAHIIKSCGAREDHFCRIYGDKIPIREPIVSCTEYDDKRLPSRGDMDKLAWTIESRVRGPMGFADGTGKDKGKVGDREVTIQPPKKIGFPWED